MEPSSPRSSTQTAWVQVISAALLMVATLPGRTQGLGLITEPMLGELKLGRESYAQINLWATLLGALACLPMGTLIDRRGPRLAAWLLLPALALTVLAMSGLTHPGVAGLFGLILLTRALGQSALSVLSLEVAGKAFKQGKGGAAAAYAVLLSVFFMVAFVVIGGVIREEGWRVAWGSIGVALLILTPLALVLRNTPGNSRSADADPLAVGFTLAEAARQPAFWVYGLGIAAFAGVQAGVGLFNEALLKERGFDSQTYHHFLAASAIIALLGQMVCGFGTRWFSIRFWLGGALLVQAGAMVMFSLIDSSRGLWTLAALSGISGGIITVAFFAIWGETFGKRHLGRIQGVAQMLSVLASAAGPLLLEVGKVWFQGYAPALRAAAPVVVLLSLACFLVRPRPLPSSSNETSSL